MSIISQWLSEAEAQKILCLKRTSLWKLRDQGKIHYAKIGRRTLYHLPSLEQFIADNSTISFTSKLSINVK